MKRELQREVRDEADIRNALAWADALIRRGLAAGPVLLSLGRPRRSLDQNSLLWPLLKDISRQVDWYGQRLTEEEWKDVFSAALKKQKVVPGLDGGFVVCGQSTSKMPKALFSEMIELIYAFGAEHGVKWSKTDGN